MTHNNVTVNREENVVEVSSFGVQGPRGKGVLHGEGPPASSLGIDGEFYIDTLVNKMYGPKISGSWGTPVNLGGTYVHTQDVAATTWVINHNLDYFPNIETVDSAGNDVVGNHQYVNSNRMIVSFSDPFAGKAYLS